MRRIFKNQSLKVLIFLALWLTLFPSLLLAQGNTTNDSFQTAKHLLSEVYKDHRITFYCGAECSEYGEIRPPKGFSTPKYENRATRMEWEHSVPAEAFGRNFLEWKHGGRKHTEKVNQEYRLIQADMYNLYPAIGAVNAMRSNYEYTEFRVVRDEGGKRKSRATESRSWANRENLSVYARFVPTVSYEQGATEAHGKVEFRISC